MLAKRHGLILKALCVDITDCGHPQPDTYVEVPQQLVVIFIEPGKWTTACFRETLSNMSTSSWIASHAAEIT